MMVLAAAAVLASPAAAQQAKPVTVYFDAGSDALDAEDRALLEEGARQLMRFGLMEVRVTGHADGPEGTAEETAGLSQRRAANVEEFLLSYGVPAGVMAKAAHGETRPAIETAGPEPANRRVEITFGPGSGW
ncbi:OmpA family protein [Roseibacterium beibuensis]|nr:OmpA family protein [Roseibacterium beibuensis]